MFISIVKIENNRIAKFAEFADESEAVAHAQEHGGFVHEGSYRPDLWVDGEAIRIAPLPAPPGSRQLSPLEFLERFTEGEQLAVVQATMQNAAVKLWYDKLLAASYVDLTDPRTEAGLDALIAAGLIAADRKSLLLLS